MRERLLNIQQQQQQKLNHLILIDKNKSIHKI